MTKRILVTGAAGFVGSHLANTLGHRKSYEVIGVDYKSPRFYGVLPPHQYRWDADLRNSNTCLEVLEDVDEVYHLAANMGGAGFVFTGHNDAEILADNTAINLGMAHAMAFSCPGFMRYQGKRQPTKILFTSSACIYPQELQKSPDAIPLKESDAWPANPDSVYGWEKLNAELLFATMGKEAGFDVRIAHFHNIYGPYGSWNDGREKVPAALCRKIAYASFLDRPAEIEIWGDGEQTRSFMYVHDCVNAIMLLMASDYDKPLNIGTDRLVSINELADIIADIAGVEIIKKHDLSRPQGVRGRNADLTLMREILEFEPQVSLEDGLKLTYNWIKGEIRREMEC